MICAYDIQTIAPRRIRIVMEGDGNPANVHNILGLIFYDQDDNPLHSIGVDFDVETYIEKVDNYSPNI